MRIAMTAVRALAVAAPLLMACAAHAGLPTGDFTDDPAASGLSSPTALAFLPDGRFLVTEKDGGIKLVTDGVVTSAGSMAVCTDSEMGLLGIALHPSFATNGILYLYRTEAAGGCASASNRFNQVVRATFSDGQVGGFVPILTGIRTDNGNHDGGGLRIGPDGKLYVGVGDTGVGDGGPPGTSTNPYAQDLLQLNGKMLRIELDGSVPADNPFVGTSARSEVYAYGFRNPFRFGFDPLTGALWVGDVGQETVEEIDRVVAGSNHSWPYCEGSLPNGCAHNGDSAPVYEYPHNGNHASVTGGAFAVGGTRVGEYYFADFIFDTIWRATLDDTRTQFVGTPDTVVTAAGGPADLVFGPDGALYYVAYGAGEVRRLGSPGFGPPPSTTTTIVVTTTTTSAPGTCGGAATFSCAEGRLDVLSATVTALGDLGRLDERLTARLARAVTSLGTAEQLAAEGRTPAARRALRRALRALAAFRGQLRSRAGRRHVDLDMRSILTAQLDESIAALRALRRGP